MKRLSLLAALVVFGMPARSLEWVKVGEFQALAGQVMRDGKASDWQGNASLHLSPAVKFNDQWGLIPTYSGSYQGTKSVTELAGGGQLFQDSQSHGMSAKGIYANGPWRLKPSMGFRWDLLRETADEDWGDGLFDYRKYSMGVEADHVWSEKVKFTAALDYYMITFPNYTSLASKSPAGLGREQSEKATLDTDNYSWSGGASFPLPFQGGWGKLVLNATRRNYPDQHLVSSEGILTTKLRSDDIKSAGGLLGYGLAFPGKVFAGFTIQTAYARYDSDQNRYDAGLNFFNSNYYSYEERTVSPRVSLQFGKAEYSFAYLRIQREYLGRLAQTASGAYTNETTAIEQDSFLFDLSLPVARAVRFIVKTSLSNSGSNSKYEKVFRYNYTLMNHLVGFAYTY